MTTVSEATFHDHDMAELLGLFATGSNTDELALAFNLAPHRVERIVRSAIDCAVEDLWITRKHKRLREVLREALNDGQSK